MSKFENSDEITDFDRVFKQLKIIEPEKVVFTHIEENRGMDHGDLMEFAEDLEENVDFSVDISFDGMEIQYTAEKVKQA